MITGGGSRKIEVEIPKTTILEIAEVARSRIDPGMIMRFVATQFYHSGFSHIFLYHCAISLLFQRIELFMYEGTDQMI